jgi:hypothetical protein
MKFNYPRLTFLAASIVIAYILFTAPSIRTFLLELGQYSYLGALVAGFLFAFGFSAPIAIGIFLILNPSNIWIATVLGGLGAMLGDLTILKVIKVEYQKEFNLLKKTKLVHYIEKPFKHIHTTWLKKGIAYLIGGFFMITPLPDEIGVSIIAGLAPLNQKTFALISFALHTSAILFLLWLPY